MAPVENLDITHGLEKIVLLEDFVGCGEQMKAAIEYCLALPNTCPALITPIIVAPNGTIKQTMKTSRLLFDFLFKLIVKG